MRSVQSIPPWDFKMYQLELRKDKETEGIRAKCQSFQWRVSNFYFTIKLLKISTFGINIFKCPL